MSAVTDTGAGFQRPEDFDPAAVWQERTRAFEENRHTVPVRVRLSERGMSLLRTVSPPRTAAGAEDAVVGADG
ncbi:hypothetical protein [Haloactinospora alba]